MASKRASATRVQYGGRTYLVGLPTSEQPPVLRVSTRFTRPVYRAEDVTFSKEDIDGLASVYVRIYQVPEKTRERLETWRRAHRQLVQSWKQPFWNKKAHDEDRGIRVRPAGIPPAALEQLKERSNAPYRRPNDRTKKKSEEEEDMEEADGSDSDRTMDHMEADDAAYWQDKAIKPATQPLKPASNLSSRSGTPAANTPPQVNGLPRVEGIELAMLGPAAAPAPVPSGFLQGFAYEAAPQTAPSLEEHIHKEFEAARDSIKDMFAWFQQAGVTMDDRDPLKAALMAMSWTAATSFERASQAVKASRELLDQRRTVTEEEFQRRVVERRAHAAAPVAMKPVEGPAGHIENV